MNEMRMKQSSTLHPPITWTVVLLSVYYPLLSNGVSAQSQPHASTGLSEVAATRLRETYTGAETVIAVSPDGAFVAVGNSVVQGGRLDVWDAALGTKLYSLPLSWGVGSRFTFSHDSKRLAAATEYSAVTIHNAKSGARELRIDTHDSVDCLAFTANDATLLTGHSTGKQSTAVLWSLDTGKQLRGFPERVEPRRSYPDPATASPEEVVRALREILSTTGPQHVEFMYALAVHPDGERVVTLGQEDGGKEVPKIWSLSRGMLLHTLDVHGQRLKSIVFSPDGKYLAGGTAENTILIWDTANWSTVRTFGQPMPPTKDRVTGIMRFHETTALAFSPDGRRLVSGHSGGGEITRLWDFETGGELDSYTSQGAYGATALTFVNSGHLVLASGTDFLTAFFVEDGFIEPYPVVGLTRREQAERTKAATTLISAVREKDIEGVRALLSAGTDPNHSGDDGSTALLEAVSTGEIALVAALVGSGTDVNGRDRVLDVTPLWLAAAKGQPEIAALLCENGADVNAVGRFGASVLQWAASNGEVETVKVLVKYGAEVNARDDSGATALSMARANGHGEVVRILLGAGAK